MSLIDKVFDVMTKNGCTATLYDAEDVVKTCMEEFLDVAADVSEMNGDLFFPDLKDKVEEIT